MVYLRIAWRNSCAIIPPVNSPTVSVILPAYNAEAFVAQAVESVRAQTYTDYELIAVNDGSADRTGEILDELARKFPAMRVIHQPNAGLAAARNAAVAQMRGEYIALLDADDLWRPGKLARCMTFLKEHPDLSIVYTPMTPFDGRTGREMTGHSKPCHAGWLTEKLFLSIFVHDPAAVFHKRVIETCGGFDESLPVSVGNEFWLRVSTKFAFGLIDEPLALRRWSETSLTRSNRLRGRRIKADMLEEFYFHKGGKDRIPRAAAMRRLAKVNYSAGKLFLQRFQCRKALRRFTKALKFRPGFWKCYPFALLSVPGSVIR
ncbi:MAG: glycosyltransferase family 2 protein [Phycisphaerae bacterium]|nr:glycosyltransferase family 2 protein [Phycisphaerae bacterium]